MTIKGFMDTYVEADASSYLILKDTVESIFPDLIQEGVLVVDDKGVP